MLTVVVIVWYVKIWLHFRYLRATRKELGNSNLVSFFVDPANLFKIMIVTMPFLFVTGKTKMPKAKVERRRLWIGIFFLWLMFGVTFYYLYQHPPSHEVQTIEYDFTNGRD